MMVIHGRRRAKVMGLALSAVTLTACASAPPQLRIHVNAASDSNDRLPCYLLVRRVDPKSYVSDAYQTVASMVMTPDDSVVASALIFPGAAQELNVPPPKTGQLAVYVLFTYPSGDWKTLVPSTGDVTVKLAASHLSRAAR